jgi:hypothetical protein
LAAAAARRRRYQLGRMDVVGDEETPEAVRNTNSYEEIKLRKL